MVAPTGGKLWRGKYRWEGKERTLSLGSYPMLSLARARANWDAAREIKRAGIDPNAAKKLTGVTGHSAGRPTTAPSLETIARDWYQRNLARWTPHHAAKVLVNLERDRSRSSAGSRPTT